jgi:hypothetical protein
MGLVSPRWDKYGSVRIAEMDALRAKLELCDKLNADPYLRTLPLSKRWKWKPRKPADVIANTPDQAHAETRAVEYAITVGIPFTTRPDGAFVFLDLRGINLFPIGERRTTAVSVRQRSLGFGSPDRGRTRNLHLERVRCTKGIQLKNKPFSFH